MRQQKTIREKANRYFFTKIAVNALLIILAALLIAFSLHTMQRRASFTRQRQNSEMALTAAVSTLNGNTGNADELARVFHEGNQDILDGLKALLETTLSDYLSGGDRASRADSFSDLMKRSGVEQLFVMREDGRAFLAPSASLIGENLVQAGVLSEVNRIRLLQETRLDNGAAEPVYENISDSDNYFYSVRLAYGEGNYYLVLGADAGALDAQLGVLKNISSVLSQAAVGNNGFLFAVYTGDGTYLSFINGDEDLSWQNSAETGLSQAALQDGYEGIETIRGVKYYCVSKAADEDIVIIAAVRMAKLAEKDLYALFWSVIGFVLVMLICLLYAVIVRNDFVRHAVETKKEIFPGRSSSLIIFDKSILKKVLPLMTVGVLLIFCISLYTQTLLEISGGIEKSQTALQNVSGIYQELRENREVVEKDYSSRYLAKAKLIACLLEEDPSVLNEPSMNRYMFYDDYGLRVSLPDDEGNPLTSVASSARLQQMCRDYDLESIYVFNVDGRTIATSTPNWYFTLSRDESDQSYEFLPILEGKTDSYVQSAQVSDLEEFSQYIGVAFNYYTSKDEAGNTVYLSRRDYESWLSGDTEYDHVTPFRSLLQIGINSMLSEDLVSSDYNSTLAKDMLNGGFILMFDSHERHTCLESPFDETIGMAAEEMGISPNAFSVGDYYSFTWLNGGRYFLYVRYDQRNYFATAIPAISMFQSRLSISCSTALISLILILFLTATATFTTKEEELLYATLSEEQAKRGFNSRFFSILLPSGRRASTAKAAARWDNRHIPWGDKTPEQKLTTLIGIQSIVLLAYLILAVVGARTIFQEESVIYYILSGNWDRGINIFAISACAMVLLLTLILVNLIRFPVQLFTSLLGTRSETVAHLLLSFIRYGGTLAALFYCLYLLGVDAQGLLASASILSLIIGLGAQSLIKDIIAGIFIVFEGEFRVGDIITIDNYRGTVMDIGLRTTKILGVDGNVKIFNNSEISGVLNMTKETSVAACNISIEYGQDLDYVEAVLKRDLPELKEKNPAILEEPAYLGVSELGDSGVQLLIIARCYEENVKSVARFMNREILQIFYRNDINVPFPQVTVSNVHSEGRKTMADFQMPDAKSLYRAGREVRSDNIVVTGLDEGLPEALQTAEDFAEMCSLTRKQMLHLRMLTEELLGMLRAIAGDVQAVYWIIALKKDFELHLLADVNMTKELREQLLSVSSSGRNDAALGFMSRLRDMIFARMLPSSADDGNPAFFGDGGWISPAEPAGGFSEWSMNRYVAGLENSQPGDNTEDAVLDDIEKSIVARLADDVKVSVKGYTAEIIIYKSFPEDEQN